MAVYDIGARVRKRDSDSSGVIIRWSSRACYHSSCTLPQVDVKWDIFDGEPPTPENEIKTYCPEELVEND